MSHTFRSLLAGALLVCVSVKSAAAEVVYDNIVNDLNFDLNIGTQEAGDEVFLDGTARWLSEFTFEYWGTNTLSPTEFVGDVQARIRFYLNNGPALPDVENALTPGTILFDTGFFAIDPSSRATLTFTNFTAGMVVPLEVQLPDSFTWSIEFSGLDATDTAGVTVYSPPTVGNNFDDYWVFDGSAWMLQTNVVSMDFAARISAVPEPSTVLLGLCGGLLALAWFRRPSV
jgi:hypothetical protein